MGDGVGGGDGEEDDVHESPKSSLPVAVVSSELDLFLDLLRICRIFLTESMTFGCVG